MVKMKYNTISASNLASEGKKSSFTIYADLDLSHNKMISTETEITKLRAELEVIQKALTLQTRRCRQLVTEYTKRLQQKEHQYQTEKTLRDDQLAKVVRALIMVEARLKQEQKYISHQLKEKDYVIKKQSDEIKKLLGEDPQYCTNCNQYTSNKSHIAESNDSSSEYVATDYQSSNFESLDSSSDIYATISEKSFDKEETHSKTDSETRIYQKNKGKDSFGRRPKKFQHRKSVGTYFEVLKLRSDSTSPCSTEDNTSNDYDHLEPLPAETGTDSERNSETKDEEGDTADSRSKITNLIPVFEGETNDNWYASASDQEDDEQRDIYRNNPVLECMNQILLQNMNDLNSPPKTPNIERKCVKNKKVKFSDEEQAPLTKENLKKTTNEGQDYYETPIQKIPNFYETPQSIYSNDYEQILSKCSETFSNSNTNDDTQISGESKSHVYVDLDSKSSDNEATSRKISRVPPALPPKPVNLVLKYKTQVKKAEPTESEPDYCSISELNLPPAKQSPQKISVVAEINPPSSQDVITKLEKAKKTVKPLDAGDYDPVIVNDNIPKLVVKNCVKKLNIQMAKQTPIKSEPPSPKKNEEIPKLPQVSEIIIPDESSEDKSEDEERVNQDNYVKNNSQILKSKTSKFEAVPATRRSIVIGTSVSNLITGFNNNQQLISEISKKPERGKLLDKRMFSSFENLQSLGKQVTPTSPVESSNFDLSQNFEEFKLDDCEIEEYDVSDIPDLVPESSTNQEHKLVEEDRGRDKVIRATENKNRIDKGELQEVKENFNKLEVSDQTYEHFLECTGLSSKSILTPSRLLSNHKSMLKPKDIKLRSKVRANHLFERNNTSTIKYWTEPYI